MPKNLDPPPIMAAVLLLLLSSAAVWKNEDSIYYHKPGEFLDFIKNVADRSISVFALQRFRERECLPKRFREMKIQELRLNDQLIAELYNSLRNGMQPLSKLRLPFTTNKQQRGQELIDNIVEYGFDINLSRAKYDIVKGHYSSEGLDYHYVFEIAAAPYRTPDLVRIGQFDFIGMVNTFPGIDNGHQAADRAQMYFKGKWYSIGLEEIERLAWHGADILIIEKEGIADQLAAFADEYGIALLYTRGFSTESDALCENAFEKDCNISLLTDFDDSGLVISAKAPKNVYRIGIDFQTLQDLDLNIEDVEEAYDPGHHLDSLLDKTEEGGKKGEYYGVYPDEIIKYIKHSRIEINSIITELDDYAKFWEWILDKLREKFPNRNYNRAIDIPEYVVPEPVNALNEQVKEEGTEIIEQHRKKLQEMLSDIGPGFLFDKTNEVLEDKGKDIMTIPKYEQILVDHSRHIIESDCQNFEF